MARSMQGVLRLGGILVGGLLLAAGIGSVLFGKWNPMPPSPPQVVRPVKTVEAVRQGTRPARRFPGVVQAGRTVDLSFQVAGPLLGSNLSLGQEVKADQLLLEVDPVRFEQAIATLRPQVDVARTRYETLKSLEERGAANPLEIAEAKGAFESAQAQLAVAIQSLADTKMKAPFPALIVGRFANDFENIQPGKSILRLQDISTVDVAVDLPDTVASRPRRAGVKLKATFSVLPGREFDVEVKEASAEADPQTGTYRAIFTMPRVEGANLLPGMAANLVIPAVEGEGDAPIVVPAEAVWVDENGKSRVWILKGDGSDMKVEAVTVEVSNFSGDDAVIASGAGGGEAGVPVPGAGGLEPGSRVVTAGVAFLREGQQVRLAEGSR